MKRVGLWAMKIGLMICVGIGAVELGYAGEKEDAKTCTLATLNGQYLGHANGMLFPPAFGVLAPSVSAAASIQFYNGDGTGEDFVTFTINGVNANAKSPTPTSYTLRPDCTGTKTVLPSGAHFNIFVAFDGERFTFIATDPGFAASGSATRVGSE
jgi:hypothetical protein